MLTAWSAIRSTTGAVRAAEMTNRRSDAAGCLSASISTHISSISSSIWSMASSSWMTRSARTESRSVKARIELAIACSAAPPITSSLSRMRLRSSAMSLFCISRPKSAEPPRHIIFGHPVFRISEYLLGRIIFYQLTQPEEGRPVRDARGLLHVVGHDYDCIPRFQLYDQLFDLLGRERIQ